MHARRARVNDALGNTLVIEVRDFFAKDEIFQQHRPARVRFERILIVGKRDALICGVRGVFPSSFLMQLAARRDL